MEAGQESSDDKVSGSVFLYVKETLLKVLRKYFFWPTIFFWKCLYSVRGAVTCLLTVPIVKEFRRFGDNFPNFHGSYLVGTYAL